jgi:hypothetical protein
MSKYIATYVIEGEAYEVCGVYDQYPEVDDDGKRVNPDFDFYDVYTQAFTKDSKTGELVGYQTCINDGNPFKTFPSEADIRRFLNIPIVTVDDVQQLWMDAEDALREGDDDKCLELKESFAANYELLSDEDKKSVEEYLESVGG